MFRIAYDVTQRDIVTVRNADDELTMVVAAFLTDPLDTLADAAIHLLLHRDEVTFQWADEPGTWEWVIQRSGDVVQIVIAFSRLDFGKRVMTDTPSVQFQTQCRLLEFTGQVLSILDRVQREGHATASDTEQYARLKKLQREYRRTRNA